MIKVIVESYCHDCPNFEADVQKLYKDDTTVLTSIFCIKSGECARLVRHLESKVCNHVSNNS